MDRIKISELIARLLTETRYESKKSQEYMAMGLGVAKNTIYNWEKGTSSPSLVQFIQWFDLLNINPTPYLFQIANPQELDNIKASDSDERIEDALETLLSNMDIEQKRALLYIIYGSHGSNPNSVLQMILADMHCPMPNRVNVAQTILDNYKIAENRNELVDTEHILPDIVNLEKAVTSGREAAYKNQNSY